nr:MAG TPA: hypothetical protein [Caudoviricetes sp.]
MRHRMFLLPLVAHTKKQIKTNNNSKNHEHQIT